MSRTIEVDTKTFVRFWLVILGLGLLWVFLMSAGTALIIIGIAVFLAIAIHPLVRKIDGIDKKKSRPGLSAGLAVGGLVLLIGVVLATVGPMVVSETSRFLSQAPDQIQNSGAWDMVNSIGEKFGISDAKAQVVTLVKNTTHLILGNIPETLVASVNTVASVLTSAILVIVLTILFMTQGEKLWNNLLAKIYAKNDKALALSKELSSKVAGVISKYMTGQVVVAILDGVVVGVAVFVLSLLFGFSSGLAFPMAMIAMIFYLIPMFGPIITCVLVALLIFFSSPWAAFIFIVFYAVYAQVENNVISPRIQGNSLDLPPLVILIAVVIGMYTFGLIGAIISIPIAGCIKVFVDEYPKIKALREN